MPRHACPRNPQTRRLVQRQGGRENQLSRRVALGVGRIVGRFGTRTRVNHLARAQVVRGKRGAGGGGGVCRGLSVIGFVFVANDDGDGGALSRGGSGRRGHDVCVDILAAVSPHATAPGWEGGRARGGNVIDCKGLGRIQNRAVEN